MKNTEFLVFIVLRALTVGYFTTVIEPLNLRFTPTCEFSIGYINRRLAGPPVPFTQRQKPRKRDWLLRYLHKQHLSSHVLVLAHDGMQKSQFGLNSHLSIVSPILQFYARLCHIFLDLEEDLGFIALHLFLKCFYENI